MRLGLCCQFLDRSIRFRTTTASALEPLDRAAQLQKLDEIVAYNIEQLGAAFCTCEALGIAAFRIQNNLLPVATKAKEKAVLRLQTDLANRKAKQEVLA